MSFFRAIARAYFYIMAPLMVLVVLCFVAMVAEWAFDWKVPSLLLVVVAIIFFAASIRRLHAVIEKVRAYGANFRATAEENRAHGN